MRERREDTVLKVGHQNSVQNESVPSEFDARGWKRDLPSLVVKGGDTRPWSTEIGVSSMKTGVRGSGNVQLGPH